jgi:diacylglycerol kinase family enzyme
MSLGLRADVRVHAVNLPVPTRYRHSWVRADASRRPVLLINPRSGGGRAGRVRLAEAARERGIEAVLLEPGDDLDALAAEAAAGGADVLGMAGGDGSLSVVASAAAAHGIPFVCIPAGTRNHFARDLGLDPKDLVAALDAFTDALEARIDLGDVNGRPFLNNISLGVYAAAVQREGYRNAKARTLFETAAEVLGPSAEVPGMRVVDDLGTIHTDPAVVLVSNNPYAMRGPRGHGLRPALDTGELGVLVLYRPGGVPRPPGRGWTARSLEVTARDAVAAGLDGEAIALDPTLHFSIRSKALRVRVPARGP